MTTEKLWGKKNNTERGLKNQRKYDNIEFIYIYIYIYIYSEYIFIHLYSYIQNCLRTNNFTRLLRSDLQNVQHITVKDILYDKIFSRVVFKRQLEISNFD